MTLGKLKPYLVFIQEYTTYETSYTLYGRYSTQEDALVKALALTELKPGANVTVALELSVLKPTGKTISLP